MDNELEILWTVWLIISVTGGKGKKEVHHCYGSKILICRKVYRNSTDSCTLIIHSTIGFRDIYNQATLPSAELSLTQPSLTQPSLTQPTLTQPSLSHTSPNHTHSTFSYPNPLFILTTWPQLSTWYTHRQTVLHWHLHTGIAYIHLSLFTFILSLFSVILLPFW